MFRLMILTALITPAQYKEKLLQDMIQVFKQEEQCTDKGYDLIYRDISIVSMIDESLPRPEAIENMRRQCTPSVFYPRLWRRSSYETP